MTPARATGPVIACYEDQPNGYGIIVHATLPVDVDPDEDHDFAIVDLPEIGKRPRPSTAAPWTTSC